MRWKRRQSCHHHGAKFLRGRWFWLGKIHGNSLSFDLVVDVVDLQESGERVGSEEEEGENLQGVQVEREFILPQNKESQELES